MSDVPTPWKRASSKQRSARSERQGAALEGGRTQPNSGALWNRKGDYRANGYLIEDKFTDEGSFTITLKTWLKIGAEALQQGLLPSMRITIQGHKMRVLREDDYLYLVVQAESKDVS